VKKRLIPVLFAALLLLGYLGYRQYRAAQPYEWSGTVEARAIEVGSRTGGRVKEVLAQEGDRMKAGQPLVVLEASDLHAQKLIAQGQLGQAQGNLEKVLKGSRPEEIEQARARATTATAALQETKAGARSEQLGAAAARLSAAQVAVDKAKTDFERAQRLFATGAIARAEADNLEAALQSAIAQRDAQKQAQDELTNGARKEDLEQAAARAREAQANAKLVQAGSRIEDIKAAQGSVDAAKGRVDEIDVMLDELTIRVPVASRIESLDLRPGDLLAPNATAATLLEDDQLYVRIFVPETQIGKLRISQGVPVTVDSFPDKTFEGIVEHINSVGEFSPRNLQTADERADQVFAARIGLRDGRDQLRAGMAAFIRVPR
jgi:HlyD family secretion protein